jgi:hypothetical protein
MRSRLATPVLLPDVCAEPERWLSAIRELGPRACSPPVLIPTGDEHALLVSADRDERCTATSATSLATVGRSGPPQAQATAAPTGLRQRIAEISTAEPEVATRTEAMLRALATRGRSPSSTSRDPRDGRDLLIEINPRSVSARSSRSMPASTCRGSTTSTSPVSRLRRPRPHAPGSSTCTSAGTCRPSVRATT